MKFIDKVGSDTSSVDMAYGKVLYGARMIVLTNEIIRRARHLNKVVDLTAEPFPPRPSTMWPGDGSTAVSSSEAMDRYLEEL